MKTNLRSLCAIIALGCAMALPLSLQTGCTAIGAAQSAPRSARTIAFLSMQDSWALAKGTFEAFAAECARGNARALARQPEIDRKFDAYRAVILKVTDGLTTNWSPTTPAEQAALVAEIVNLIEALGIKRKI